MNLLGRFFVGAAMLAMAAGCGGDAGPAGPAGDDGTNGADGLPGADGQDGTNGTNGGDGVDGTDGTNGTDGTDGSDGTDGTNGQNGGNVEVGDLHGTDYLLSSGEYADAGKEFVSVTITGATIANGVVTVDYTVEDADGNPIAGITGGNFNVVQLQPAAGDEAFNKWVSYVYRTETVSGTGFPMPDGTTAEQAYRENTGVKTDHGDGSYTYEYAVDVTAVAGVTYDATLTHRVSVMLGGHSGPTGDAVFDFRPDGQAVTETRDIVGTDACKDCHGVEFAGHGGDRLTVENCVTCHNAGNLDAQSGNDVDFKVMLHKIHAGGELATIPGADGIVWDNPATPGDESADNGWYSIFGHQNHEATWWKAEFPAIIENCTKCHTGTGADVDNWKTVPSRDACGSCHDDIDWAAGTNHAGGAYQNDTMCAGCHPADTGANSVTVAHEWWTKVDQNIPEFDIDVTISTPANGTHFVAGEAPVVTVVINENGTPINHLTEAVEDTTGAEGCTTEPCGARDHTFTSIGMFVHGPRADFAPVLSTQARAVVASTAGPFDLTAGGNLTVVFDGGLSVHVGDKQSVAGTATVNLGTGAATTVQNVVDALNANAAFAARGIAYVENNLAKIRSRNLGNIYSVRLEAGNATTVVFNGDVTAHAFGASTPKIDLRQRSNPANNDPKVDWFADRIEYTLDAVDDLAPGTYAVTTEIADRGRVDGANYKTPSVSKSFFQVGQADEELPVARNCDSCHQADNGQGFILDFSRHDKIFDDLAVTQCAGCHDYQPQNATGAGWTGGKPISKRVHAVHFGSSLNYPLETVDYQNGDPVAGRNWDITFPQDVRHCQSCHPDGTTSGSWMTNAARLPCKGCHDADSTETHMKLMTWDPTPTNPWSGDEEESCQACH